MTGYVFVHEVGVEELRENCHTQIFMECVTSVNELMTAGNVDGCDEADDCSEYVILHPGFRLDLCKII